MLSIILLLGMIVYIFLVPNFETVEFSQEVIDNIADGVTTTTPGSQNNDNVSETQDNTELSKLGDYFEPQPNIHKLKLYEGDTLLESRFGQSIRFSGYNNGDNEFSPTITIRNGESGESLSKEIGASTEEDINKDNNIIFLGSSS